MKLTIAQMLIKIGELKSVQTEESFKEFKEFINTLEKNDKKRLSKFMVEFGEFLS